MFKNQDATYARALTAEEARALEVEKRDRLHPRHLSDGQLVIARLASRKPSRNCVAIEYGGILRKDHRGEFYLETVRAFPSKLPDGAPRRMTIPLWFGVDGSVVAQDPHRNNHRKPGTLHAISDSSRPPIGYVLPAYYGAPDVTDDDLELLELTMQFVA